MQPQKSGSPRLPCWRWPTRSFVNTRTSSTACAPTRWSRRGHSGVQGEFFLAEDGTPTGKTMAVFNMFKLLAQQLSGKYTLA